MAVQNNVGTAVNTAEQFMPKGTAQFSPSYVGINSAAGLTQNQDTADIDLAKALGVSAATLVSYAGEREKQQKTVADAIAPLVYGQADAKTRQVAGASQLIADSGQTFLQDNPYATALINHLQGQELASNTYKQYQVYSSQFPLKDNLEDEVQSFDTFVKGKMADYLAKTTPDNPQAFQQGFAVGRVAATGDDAQLFSTQKQEQMGITRSQQLLGWVDTQSRQMLNSNAEQQQKFVDTLSQMYQTTAFRDSDKGHELLKSVMLTVAKNTGNTDLIDKLGKMPYQGGTISDSFDVSAVKDIATATAQSLRLKGFQGLSDTLSKCKTTKDLYDTYNSLTPDQQRIIAPQLPHMQATIETNLREQQRQAQAQQKLVMKNAKSQIGASSQIAAIAAGLTSDSYGRPIALSGSDLTNMGIDKEQFLSSMTTYIASKGVDYYNSEDGAKQLSNLITNPLAKESFSSFLTNNSITGLNSIQADGSFNPSFNAVLQFYQKSPGLFNELVSDDKTKMGVFICSHMGPAQYLAAQPALADQSTMDNYSTQLQGDGVTGSLPTKLGQIDLDSFADPNTAEGLTNVASGSNTVELRNRAVLYAKSYMASGLDADSASMSAVDQLKREYFAFQGAPIPKMVTNLVGSEYAEDDRRSAFHWELQQAFQEYCDSQGISKDLVTVSYSPRQGGNALITFSNGPKSLQLSVATLAAKAHADLVQRYSNPDTSDEEPTYTQVPTPVYSGVQSDLDYVNKTDGETPVQPGDYVY